MAEEHAGRRGGLEGATIPVGGSFWRALGKNGALLAGYAIVLVHAALLVVDALVSPGLSYRDSQAWGTAVLWSTVIAPLLAMCFLIIGELLRRGDWGGPSGHKPDALLPQGSNTVTLRAVPLGWHLVWIVIALGVAAALLVGVAADPWTERFTVWTVNGIVAVGIAGAVLASMVKKWSWARGGNRRFEAPAVAHPALANRGARASRGQLFWRWVGFRWRLDLWACAFGLIAVWLGVLMLLTRDVFSSSAESTTLAAQILIPGGAVLALVALWATTQFWRSGEDLAGAESLA